MNGQDLIRFIEENKLQDMEIYGVDMEGLLQFGPDIKFTTKEHQDQILSYCLYAGDKVEVNGVVVSFIESRIELIQDIKNSDGYITHPSSAEALDLRKMNKLP